MPGKVGGVEGESKPLPASQDVEEMKCGGADKANMSPQ